ncbi:MAG TPA: FAD-dependent oxidoreductase, partial [Nitrospiria bacterium]|nr:FAD-dependent oxidoreductase [Nitrospiria bacterium]
LTGQKKPFAYLPVLRHSPMIATHLWFDRPVMEEEFVGLINSPIHWVFNKSSLWTEGEKTAGALSCHSSAVRNLVQRPKDVLINTAIRELSRFFPEVKKARLVHSRLVKERQATLSCTPEAERLRPEQKTPVRNFYLAGDWTRTGLPSSIESAVVSGRRCADLIEQAG